MSSSEFPPLLPATELRNPDSTAVDSLSPLEIVRLMNRQDRLVVEAVAREEQHIAAAIDIIAGRISAGGRLIYMGAGTSGRLGVLDASECPPTFSVPPGLVTGLIAGGRDALTTAIEGAEDRREDGRSDLENISLTAGDVVMGIATSGRTPYVLGGLEYARQRKAVTLGLACSPDSALVPLCDVMITPLVGPEILTGSTRLKSGTATKLVLNMLTTGAMIRLGKTYGNLMVDLTATNDKLRDRARRIVAELTGLNTAAARELLARCDGQVKTAVVVHRLKLTPEAARLRLTECRGHLRQALESPRPESPGQ